MLLRLSLGEEYEHRRFSPRLATVVAAVGMLIYAVAGFYPWPGEETSWTTRIFRFLGFHPLSYDTTAFSSWRREWV